MDKLRLDRLLLP